MFSFWRRPVEPGVRALDEVVHVLPGLSFLTLWNALQALAVAWHLADMHGHEQARPTWLAHGTMGRDLVVFSTIGPVLVPIDGLRIDVGHPRDAGDKVTRPLHPAIEAVRVGLDVRRGLYLREDLVLAGETVRLRAERVFPLRSATCRTAPVPHDARWRVDVRARRVARGVNAPARHGPARADATDVRADRGSGRRERGRHGGARSTPRHSRRRPLGAAAIAAAPTPPLRARGGARAPSRGARSASRGTGRGGGSRCRAGRNGRSPTASGDRSARRTARTADRAAR